MTINLTDPQAPVTDEELDHLIWGLERYGLYPRQLAALKELREWRRAREVVIPQSGNIILVRRYRAFMSRQ